MVMCQNEVVEALAMEAVVAMAGAVEKSGLGGRVVAMPEVRVVEEAGGGSVAYTHIVINASQLKSRMKSRM